MTAASCQHSTHRLQILRRVDARRDLRFAHRHRDAMAVPQRAQLLERLGLLERRGRERGVALQEARRGSRRCRRGGSTRAPAFRADTEFARARSTARSPRASSTTFTTFGLASACSSWIAWQAVAIDASLSLSSELPRPRAIERGRDQRLVALHVDHDVVVREPEQRSGFGEAVGAGGMIGARHHAADRRAAAHRGGDALVVGGDVHRGRAALRSRARRRAPPSACPAMSASGLPGKRVDA